MYGTVTWFNLSCEIEELINSVSDSDLSTLSD